MNEYMALMFMLSFTDFYLSKLLDFSRLQENFHFCGNVSQSKFKALDVDN